MGKKHYIKDRMEPKENIWDMMTSYRAEVPQVDRSNGPSNLQGHIDKMFPQSRAVRTCCDSPCSLGGPKHHRNILALETWAQHLKKMPIYCFPVLNFKSIGMFGLDLMPTRVWNGNGRAFPQSIWQPTLFGQQSNNGFWNQLTAIDLFFCLELTETGLSWKNI